MVRAPLLARCRGDGRRPGGHAGSVLDDAEAVLARARAGDGDALTAIYRDLARPVAAYLRARGVRDVEDVTSDVFVAVLTGLDRFVGAEAQLRSWVFTIAHHRAADAARRSARRPAEAPYEVTDDPRTAPSAETAALAGMVGGSLEAMLSVLTEDQREVLLLRVVAGLSVDEAATVMGRRPGAVKALQHRALSALRDVIREGVTS